MELTDQIVAADVRRRRHRLAEVLCAGGVDAAVLATEPNFLYLTGYITPSWKMRARPLLVTLSDDAQAIAIGSAAELERLAGDVSGVALKPFVDPVETQIGEETLLDFLPAATTSLVEVLRESGARRVALELNAPFAAGLPDHALRTLHDVVGIELVDVGPLLWPLRRRKSEVELALLRRSATILGDVYAQFVQEARSGMTERELHGVLMRAAGTAGADCLAYATVIVSAQGPLLGSPTDRVWAADELLLVDVGVVHRGYWADFSRHFTASEPPAATTAAYERIVAALAAGRAAVRPGVSIASVAQAITNELPSDDEGSFGRVGHGIGLDITESPSIHRSEPGELLPGAALCLEPAARFNGVGRLVGEEMVAVTEAGCELLSPLFPTQIERVPD